MKQRIRTLWRGAALQPCDDAIDSTMGKSRLFLTDAVYAMAQDKLLDRISEPGTLVIREVTRCTARLSAVGGKR